MNANLRVASLLCIHGLTLALPRLGLAQDSLLLAPDRAGPIRVGMSVSEIQKLLGQDRVLLIDWKREGHFDPALAITLPGADVSPAIIAPVREWPCPGYSVQGLQILDPRFRTAQGVGVGSTLGQLRRQYSLRLSEEEGPHAWVESIRTNFGLEDGSGRDDVRVRSVWLPGPGPDVIRRERCPTRGVSVSGHARDRLTWPQQLVRLRLSNGNVLEGRVDPEHPNSAALLLRTPARVVPYELIDSIWFRRTAIRNGAVIGGTVLGVAGLVRFGHLCFTGAGCLIAESENTTAAKWRAVSVMTLASAGAGTLLGAIVGVLVPRWDLFYARMSP